MLHTTVKLVLSDHAWDKKPVVFGGPLIEVKMHGKFTIGTLSTMASGP